MNELEARFPNGLKYASVYDTTPFIRESVDEVFHTLRDAVILIAIVVLLFLQDWKSLLLPVIDVAVSLIGTFAVMSFLGFSLNNLTLFGLVLAIGIVVDDAIVVLENIRRWFYFGLIGLTGFGFARVPGGFVPSQDKGYLLVNIQLPDSASLERTLEVTKKVEQIALETPGVDHTAITAGQSFVLNAFSSMENARMRADGYATWEEDDYCSRADRKPPHQEKKPRPSLAFLVRRENHRLNSLPFGRRAARDLLRLPGRSIVPAFRSL